MNLIKNVILLVLSSVAVIAANLTATFNGNNPPGSVEYFIEQQTAATVWTEVAKGPASPITISNLNPGIYTFRVKARLLTVTATSGPGVSNPSETAQGTVNPNQPSNIIIAVLTVEIRKDGTMRIADVKKIPEPPQT